MSLRSCSHLHLYPYLAECARAEAHRAGRDPCEGCGGSDTAETRGCDARAEWEVWAMTRDPYDVTYACTAHVGDLLTDAHEHRVYRVG